MQIGAQTFGHHCQGVMNVANQSSSMKGKTIWASCQGIVNVANQSPSMKGSPAKVRDQHLATFHWTLCMCPLSGLLIEKECMRYKKK